MRKIIIAIFIIFAITFLFACTSTNNTKPSDDSKYEEAQTIADEKNEMVQAAEDAISAIGDVTLESGDAIKTAERIFDNLTDHEKEQVQNRIDLINAKSKYEDLLEEQQRQEELRAIEEEKRIDNGIQEAADNFKTDMNVDKAITALSEWYDLGNEQQKVRINDYINEIESYCYRGTHFLTMEYVLSNHPSIEYDRNGTVVYKKDNKTYRGHVYRNDNYQDELTYYNGYYSGYFGDYHFYIFEGDFYQISAPSIAEDVYQEYLKTCFSNKKEDIDWGFFRENKPDWSQTTVFTDSKGNKMFLVNSYGAKFGHKGRMCTLHIKIH